MPDCSTSMSREPTLAGCRESRRLNHAGWMTSFVAEHLLLTASMLLLIPPVMSVAGDIPSIARGLGMPLALLAASRYLAMRRHEESWVGLITKCFIFSLAGFAIHLRVFGHAILD